MNADATFNSLIPLHPSFKKGDYFPLDGEEDYRIVPT